MDRDVVYWRGSAEVRGEVIDALREREYTVNQLRTLEDVLDRLAVKPPTILIVDATAGEREASERVVDLANTEKLFGLTVVFLSHQAHKRIDVLRKQYANLIPVDLPFKPDDILTAIEGYIAGVIAAELTAQFEAAEERRREMLAADRDPTKLKGSYGGKVLSLARDLEDFDDDALIPLHPEREVIQQMLSNMTQTDPWMGLHSRRSSFLTTAMGSNLGLDWARMSNVRTVSLLLNRGFLGLPNSVARFNFLDPIQPRSLKLLGKGLTKCGKLMKQQLNDERAQKTVEVIRKFLLGEMVKESREIVQEAQCVLAVELVSRACWETGHWNHYGAYRAVRHLRKGSHIIGDSKVRDAIIRVIGEAVCSNTTVCNVFVPESGDPMGLSSIGALKKVDPKTLSDSGRTMSIPVFDLEPGMRLANPLITYDGAEVLASDVKLSDDIIHRLWQLAAVRALRTRASVDENKKH